MTGGTFVSGHWLQLRMPPRLEDESVQREAGVVFALRPVRSELMGEGILAGGTYRVSTGSG
jgi:hypothetical protein